MIELYYGSFGVQSTFYDREAVRNFKVFQKQPSNFLKLRTLAQNEMILFKDKGLLLWHYVVKIGLISYWIFG